MKLKASFIDNELTLSNEYITAIEIENKKLFYHLVSLLNDYSKDNEIDEELFDSKIKLKIIIDFFNLDYNNKKTISYITKLIKDNFDEEKSTQMKKSYNKMLNIYNDILKEIDIPLQVDKEVNIDNLTKIFNLKIINENNILKNLLSLIDITKNTKEYNLICLINAKQYLLCEDLKELYKYAIYNGIYMLLIDSQTYGVTVNNEKKLIIDANLEEFML